MLVDAELKEVRIGNEVYEAPQKVIDYLCQVSGERDELRSHLGHEESEAVLNPPPLTPGEIETLDIPEKAEEK